jgi:hypothetical protein
LNGVEKLKIGVVLLAALLVLGTVSVVAPAAAACRVDFENPPGDIGECFCRVSPTCLPLAEVGVAVP